MVEKQFSLMLHERLDNRPHSPGLTVRYYSTSCPISSRPMFVRPKGLSDWVNACRRTLGAAIKAMTVHRTQQSSYINRIQQESYLSRRPILAHRLVRKASEAQRMTQLRANTALSVFPRPAVDDGDRIALVALGGNIVLH